MYVYIDIDIDIDIIDIPNISAGSDFPHRLLRHLTAAGLGGSGVNGRPFRWLQQRGAG